MTELNENTFENAISDALPVVVDFWAPWCGPCRSQAPILEQFAKAYDGKVKVYKVNTDENDALCTRFQMMSIPTIMVFKGGELISKAVGVQPISSLARLAGL